MRRFHNEQFPSRLADSLNSSHLDIPDPESQEALDYIKQFVQHAQGRTRLRRGYITEEYLDSLVRIREESNKRDFSSAVEQLGVDGDTSEKVTEFDTFELLELKSTEELVSTLDKVYYQVDSKECRKNIRTLQELIRNTQSGNTIRMYLPQESYTQLSEHLVGYNI